ncbi:DUF3168 domain-containing protein [Fulvimarina sp. 2208YS6-2-32]|uniref:DUF3168 domain-containing protein n=1 Tax=Fulvimarina uroteuthidis TaxID=3098149 RepID=A0ABU5I7T1_9HYPH|nr:DUF3168 domain-containing protein [Fulvimarina sp. 2208YS6-2-32]MDY8111162.1 DUF3168 domain-containing protein [Fulvimarina sp. 2208YS6-2-32]
MIDPSLDLQAAIRERLVNDAGVTALVTPRAIRDGGGRPDDFPTILFGPSQTVLEPITFSRHHVRCFVDLHVWTREVGTVMSKTIAAVAINALTVAPALAGLLDFQVDGVRYLRDPGDLGHAVISISALFEGAR